MIYSFSPSLTHWFTYSLIHSFLLSLAYLFTNSFAHSIQSIHRLTYFFSPSSSPKSINQSIQESVNRSSLNRPIESVFNQFIFQSIKLWINQTINESIIQSTLSINRWIHQSNIISINQSTTYCYSKLYFVSYYIIKNSHLLTRLLSVIHLLIHFFTVSLTKWFILSVHRIRDMTWHMHGHSVILITNIRDMT